MQKVGEFVTLVTGSDEDVSQAKQMLDKISREINMPIAVQGFELNFCPVH